MDVLGLFDLPLWIMLIAGLSLLAYIYGKYPLTIWKSLGVPGPPSRPYFGNVHELFDPSEGMCKTLSKWTKQYGKIFGVLFFRKPALVVTDPEALKEVFVKNFNSFQNHYVTGGDYLLQPEMKKSIFFSKGQDWKRMRQIMSPAFSSGKLKHLTHYINTTAEQLVHALRRHVEDGTCPEAKVVYSAYSLDVIAGTSFGIELDSQTNSNNPFYQYAKSMTTLKKPIVLQLLMAIVEIFPCLGFILKSFKVGFLEKEALRFFVVQLTELISMRKANPEQIDFLQLLINAETDAEDVNDGSKKLTTEEIIAQGVLFLYAGFESTSTTLQWLSHEIAKNKVIQARLNSEIEDVIGDEKEVGYDHCQRLKYMEAVINETLRMYPPLHMLTRLTEEETTLKGFTVPANAAIIIPAYNIGRDPELFEEPDTFNPDRFIDSQNNPVGFLPFGFGPRQCIGMRIAMMQIKVALVHVLKAISIEDTNPKEVDIQDFTGFLIPKEPIKLTLNVK